MKYLLFSLLSLVAIAGHGQIFQLRSTTPCGTWVHDKDTVSDWETLDTLGDKANMHLATPRRWVYGPKEKVLAPRSPWGSLQFSINATSLDSAAYHDPCWGGDESQTWTQDRIDSLTGIRQRQTIWDRYKYIPFQPTPFERLRDSLQKVGDSVKRLGNGHPGTFYGTTKPVFTFSSGGRILKLDTTAFLASIVYAHSTFHLSRWTNKVEIGGAIYLVHHDRNEHYWLTRETPKK